MSKKKSDVEQVQEKPVALKFQPSHPEQLDALKCCQENAIAFLTGPPGTSKTYTSIHYAISTVLDANSQVQKLYLSRPAVPMGRDLGFLPGTAKEKLAPFLQAVHATYKKQLAYSPKLLQEIERAVEYLPTQFIRGQTINDILVVDEAQNCTGEEILAICTRIGKGGKIIFCGDISQSDLKQSPLREAAVSLSGLTRKGLSVGHFEFSPAACVRHPLISAITERADRAGWSR